MSEEPQTTAPAEEPAPEFLKVAIGLVIAIVILGGIVYAGYQYSQRQTGKVTLPNGYPVNYSDKKVGDVDCSKERNPNVDIWDYYKICDPFKVGPENKWVVYTDPQYKFTMLLPEGMPHQNFNNGLGLAYKEFDPPRNLIYSVDNAVDRQGDFKNYTGQQYVENYWKQYPGLNGIKSLEPIINGKGIPGWKAIYLIGEKAGNQEIFFELGEGTGNFVHFTSGILDQPVYDNIVGTYEPPKNLVVPKPTTNVQGAAVTQPPTQITVQPTFAPTTPPQP